MLSITIKPEIEERFKINKKRLKTGKPCRENENRAECQER